MVIPVAPEVKNKGREIGPRPGAGRDEAAEYNRQRLADGAACLAAALEYLRRGWPVLALCPPDHVGVGKAHAKGCASAGKRPWHTWKKYQSELPTETTVRSWWGQQPAGNVGVALGPLGGIVRLDVDGPGGERLLAEWSGGDLPPTLEFTSGRANGGRGILYGIPADGTFKTTYEQPDRKEELRFQALGAQTVLPPSRHPDGGLYAWLPGRGPGEIGLAPAPAWVVARWGAGAGGKRAGRAAAAANGERIIEGGRNATLASFAGTMRRRGFSRAAIEAALLEENAARCAPPLDNDEVRVIAGHIARYAPHEGNGRHPANGQAAGGQAAPPAGQTGHEIIRKHFEEAYGPRFRRGTSIYSTKLGREVKGTEGIWGAGTELLGKLSHASNAPRDKKGVVQWNSLPQFFSTWAKSAWVDMLKTLPEEEVTEEVDATAEEEFRLQLAAALSQLVTLDPGNRHGKDAQPERRSIIDWAARFAKSGPWRSIRSYRLWCRLAHEPGGGVRLQVALRAELFAQLNARELAKINPTKFARLCATYGVGQSLESERPQGKRAVILEDGFLHELFSGPEPDQKAAKEGEQAT